MVKINYWCGKEFMFTDGDKLNHESFNDNAKEIDAIPF